jgi:hypothetical protein
VGNCSASVLSVFNDGVFLLNLAWASNIEHFANDHF